MMLDAAQHHSGQSLEWREHVLPLVAAEGHLCRQDGGEHDTCHRDPEAYG